MFRGLLLRMLDEDVNFAFENKTYSSPSLVPGLQSFLDSFSLTDLYHFLNENSDDPDYFSGFMTSMSILATLAIRADLGGDFQDFIELISEKFAVYQVYMEHDDDCVYSLLASYSSDGMESVRQRIKHGSSQFREGFMDLWQILYSEDFSGGKLPEIAVEEDSNEEVITEEEAWPDVIG